MDFEKIQYKAKKRTYQVGEFLYVKHNGENRYCRVFEKNDNEYILEVMPFGGMVTNWYTDKGLYYQDKYSKMYNYYKTKGV